MERYTIAIGNGFSIEAQEDVELNHSLEHIHDLGFAELEIINGKIHWLQNPFKINDEIIEACKEKEYFNEEASFSVFIPNQEEWEKKEEFEGTFIEALEYIKEEFRHE